MSRVSAQISQSGAVHVSPSECQSAGYLCALSATTTSVSNGSPTSFTLSVCSGAPDKLTWLRVLLS